MHEVIAQLIRAADGHGGREALDPIDRARANAYLEAAQMLRLANQTSDSLEGAIRSGQPSIKILARRCVVVQVGDVSFRIVGNTAVPLYARKTDAVD